MSKEIFDRTLAAIGLIVAAPLIVLLGLLIKIESSGPIFFKHLRVGRNGKRFRMYKFRKMPHDLNAGPKISPKHDPRLTKVGRVLERLKLDELPQLFNILKGDMSFVGPRPEIPEIVRLYNAEQMKVLTVKPGLVGPNQIVWRNEKNLLPGALSNVEAYYIAHILPEKITRDLRYIDEANFFLDLKYIVLALGASLFEPLKLAHFFRRKHDIFRLAVDLGLCLIAFAAALLIKYDSSLSASLQQQTIYVLPVLLFWQLTAFVFLEVYHQDWKFASQEDWVAIIKTVLFAAILTAVVIYPVWRLRFPVSVLILHAILCIGVLGGTRLLQSYLRQKISGAKARPKKNIIIYGANAEGELLLRRIHADLGPRGYPIGFLDADPGRRGAKIHGLEVLGDSYDLPLLKELYAVDEIYIATHETMHDDLQRLLHLCEQLQVKYQFVATTFAKEKIRFAGMGANTPYAELDARVATAS